MGKLPKVFYPVRQLFSNGASRVKLLKILAIIAVILMVVSVVNWFVLSKERKELEKELEGLNGKHPAASEEEVDLEEVRRIFEEEGYIEEGQYSPSPDEEYPALPLK